MEPDIYPYIAEIPDTLEVKQKIVGGFIEATYLYEDEVTLICNEEGKINGMSLNRPIIVDGEVIDIIAGNFIVCGLSSEDFGSLTDEQVQRYTRMFKKPCDFVRLQDVSSDEVTFIPVAKISAMREPTFKEWQIKVLQKNMEK